MQINPNSRLPDPSDDSSKVQAEEVKIDPQQAKVVEVKQTIDLTPSSPSNEKRLSKEDRAESKKRLEKSVSHVKTAGYKKALEEAKTNKISSSTLRPGKEEETQLKAEAFQKAVDRSTSRSKKYADIPQLQGSYVEQLKNFQTSGNPLHRESLYRFLLDPKQTQFREDYLRVGPELDYIKKDQDKKSHSFLIKEMQRLFIDHSSLEQKKEILKFAIELVKRGVFSKDIFEAKDALIEKVKEEKHDELMVLIKELKNTEPKPLIKSQNIAYTIIDSTPGALTTKLDELAAGKKDKKFIENFAKDLTALMGNIVKNTHETELHRKAWDKGNKNEIAPNIVYNTFLFNQLNLFVLEQILKRDDVKEREAIYSTFKKIADTLIKLHHNYAGAFSILSALNHSSLKKIISDKQFTSVDTLIKLFDSQPNFKNLRAAITKDQNAKEKQAFIPYIGLLTSDLTFMGENQELLENNVINFSKLRGFSSLHQDFEEMQKRLKEQKNLHYDLTQEIVQPTHPYSLDLDGEEKVWDRVEELAKPRARNSSISKQLPQEKNLLPRSKSSIQLRGGSRRTRVKIEPTNSLQAKK